MNHTTKPGAPDPAVLTREARLAAKLRENLLRRKAQTRAIQAGEQAALPKPGPKS